MFLCITLGSVIFKKHKLIGAVGVYLGFNFLISIASSVFSLFGASALTSGIQQLLWNASPNAAAGVICLLLLAYAVIMATVGITFYLITQTLIDRKLTDEGLTDIYLMTEATGSNNYDNVNWYFTNEGKGVGPFILACAEAMKG